MTQGDEVQKFEYGRIKVLQEERLHIQKKTFTKWMNSFLQKERMEVGDLFVDLADGRKLLKLLEIISGEKLPMPNNGRMRVHKIENVNKSLAFLHTKVRLESIGAEDIVDGNPTLILGLIWTIILRFQIQEIEIDVNEENETSNKKSAKAALFHWVQRKTNEYSGVNINDFSGSWRSGLGFNALIHSHRPELFDYKSLKHNANIYNLNHAFDLANNKFGIPRLLDAEDIDTSRPDEKSIITYVASYYHTFARMKNEAKSGRKIEKILKCMMDAHKMKLHYDKITTDLLEWIGKTVILLEDRQFPNSLEGIQHLLLQFAQYRTVEKPPKYIERNEIEVLFFNINIHLKEEVRQLTFTPPNSKLLQNIERAWNKLLKAEHHRELALRSELMRQQRLDHLCNLFERKSILRERYLKEMIQVLSDPIYGSFLTNVDATVKKLESISADILAREERIHDLTQKCEELQRENYRESTRVQERHDNVIAKWKEVLALLEKHKSNLNRMGNVMSLLREIDTTLSTVNQLKKDVSSIDTGMHLLAVEELLQKHALQELQVTSIGETERKLKRLGEQVVAQSPKEAETLRRKLVEFSDDYKGVQDACAERRALLEEARNFYQFLQDQEDEEAWLIEKQRICMAEITAKKLQEVLRLQQKHKLLLDEIKLKKNKFDHFQNMAKQLIQENHQRSPEIQEHIDTNNNEWANLEKLANERTRRLQDAAEAYQFYADANEVDSFLNEKKSILSSKDYGSDEPSAQALLQRHRELHSELNAYKGDIQSINNQAERLISSGMSDLDLTVEPNIVKPIEGIVYENKVVRHKMIENELGGIACSYYSKKIEPKVIQNKKEKSEKIKIWQKVEKINMQKVPVKVLRSPKLKRALGDSNTVPKRQKKINDTYNECQELAVKRHAFLEDSIRLHVFYKECDDFDKWIKDKEIMFNTDNPTENVDQAKRKQKKFVTDLSASSKRLEGIDAEVKEFEKQNHSQIDKVRARYRQITAAWERLNNLRAQKEKSLEGASILEIFLSTCDEAIERMHEKLSHLDSDVLSHDLKTVQALQRRHEQLEREITPIEKTVNDINLLANQVVASNPQEQFKVAKILDDIKDLWAQVKEKAHQRRARLEDAVGQQIFTNSSHSLLNWVSDVKNQLNADNTVRDVQTAEKFIKNHQYLGQDIKSHDDEFRQVTDLGRKLIKSNPNLADVNEKIIRLSEEQAALRRGWNEKQKWLEQCLQLQKFNKEADKIDAATSSHQAFLEFSDLGSSLDEVEALLKQHRTFTNTLVAQEPSITAFDKKADALIRDNHYDSQGIDEKRKQVLQKRHAVKNLFQNGYNDLEASKNYQLFCAEVHNLRAWLAEKLKTASDESYKDLNNLERKIKKHEHFEQELRSNEGQLRSVNKMGQVLIAEGNYKKDIVARLKDLNDEWEILVRLSMEKDRKLPEARTKHNCNLNVSDVNTKLNDIEENLNSTHVGKDMRFCKNLETSVTWKDLRAKSNNRKKNLKQPDNLQTYFNQHQQLLAWINEMLGKITAPDLPRDDTNAELLIKRHKEYKVEIDARSDIFDKFFESGHNFIKHERYFSQKIENKIKILENRLNVLKKTWTNRNTIYEQNLDLQLFKREANILENWLNVCEGTLRDNKVGDSIIQVENLIKRHEAFENTIRVYGDKFSALNRITLFEEAFAMQKQLELHAKASERVHQEPELLEQIKKLEMQRRTNQRRQEEHHDNQIHTEINGNGHDESPVSNSTKSNSVGYMFGDRRRGFDVNIKRAKSMKMIGPAKQPSQYVNGNNSNNTNRHTIIVEGKVQYDQTRKEIFQYRSNMTQMYEVQKFEHKHIKVLQEERLHILKKTYTKWINSYLQKVRMKVGNLFEDLADGKKLLMLLEIISGEKLPKPNNGIMRVHKIENINKSLAFLHTKVRLESIGAEDIVDGNPTLILGLIWTIIIRFQIQKIEIDVDEENDSSEKKSVNDALLLWVQRKTYGYSGVNINDFSDSWQNGLGFNALIHSHRPELFDYKSLKHNSHIDNLNHAFDVASNELGIPRLLDAEDIDTSRPDEKSIITYVASYYHTFARMKNEDAGKLNLHYNNITTDLLEWIRKTVILLEDRQFPNSLEGIQHLLMQFGQYRTVEKPQKYIKRNEIEALFFNINTQLNEEIRPSIYTPPDSKLLHDINQAWNQLQKAEHNRELALRNELMRLQRLKHLRYPHYLFYILIFYLILCFLYITYCIYIQYKK